MYTAKPRNRKQKLVSPSEIPNQTPSFLPASHVMGDVGYYRFPAGHLNPTAEEFYPASHRPIPVYFPYPQHHHHYSHAPPPPLPQTAAIALLPPSRVLLLSMVLDDISESIIRRDLEVFGDVRAVQMERLRREGIVTVHFYDLRQAQAALVEIQNQHMQQQYRLRRHHDAINFVAVNYAAVYVPPLPAPPHPAAPGLISGLAVWGQFTAQAIAAIPDGTNQGTLAVFNVDARVTPAALHQIFGEFGDVREVRESPKRRHLRFVEFFDVRQASRALAGLIDTEICGRQTWIEFSRPGGYNRKHYPKPDQPRRSYTRGIIPAGLPSPIIRQPSGRYVANPDYFSDKKEYGSGSDSRFSRSSSNSSRASMSLSGGPRSVKKVGSCSPATTHDGSTTSSSGGSSSKQQRHYRQNHRPRSKVSSTSSSRQSKVDSFENPDHRFLTDHRFLINEGLAIDANSMDSRTTVMIKNIPNKYSQNLLLNMLDNHCIHCNELIGDDDTQPLSSYDFVYLPIDFSNKCNVGYGFVNMTSPEATLRLYKSFHRQSWEVFNSRKICEIAYARLQGLEALKEHFKSSKFPAEVEELMPVVFTPPRDGRRLTEPAVVSSRKPSRIKSVSSSSSEGRNVINGFGCDGNSNDDEEEELGYCSRGVYSGGACGSGNGDAGGGDWRE